MRGAEEFNIHADVEGTNHVKLVWQTSRLFGLFLDMLTSHLFAVPYNSLNKSIASLCPEIWISVQQLIDFIVRRSCHSGTLPSKTKNASSQCSRLFSMCFDEPVLPAVA